MTEDVRALKAHLETCPACHGKPLGELCVLGKDLFEQALGVKIP
jgi:hypothetical protein